MFQFSADYLFEFKISKFLMSLQSMRYFRNLQQNPLFLALMKYISMLARVSALETETILYLAETIFTNICNGLSDISLFAALGC